MKHNMCGRCLSIANHHMYVDKNLNCSIFDYINCKYKNAQCYMKTMHGCLYNPNMCLVKGTAFLLKAELQVDHQETFLFSMK